jgi:hypothetical protein
MRLAVRLLKRGLISVTEPSFLAARMSFFSCGVMSARASGRPAKTAAIQMIKMAKLN